jgi:ribosomal protein S18 acetylase RimI-like enzyme
VSATTPARIEIVDVTDESSFALLPPCADPGFDHRSCDYWEDADRGSKAIRLDWIEPGAAVAPEPTPRAAPLNPFLADLEERRANPFGAGFGGSGGSGPSGGSGGGAANPLLAEDDDALADNPFAPRRAPRPGVAETAPRKLRLLGRGLGVAGSYAKVLLLNDDPAAYCQFGPLTAYPRAQRTRDLYPALPDAPLPAVITCIASTAAARGAGLARTLVAAVCDDLEGRGFAAVETYPEIGARPNATSAATPAFWESVGFYTAAPDERFPVMRRELG